MTTRLLLLIMSVILSSGAFASAGNSHKAFVTTDKIWHYGWLNYGFDGDCESETKGPSFRFLDGKVTRSGKDYSVLARFDKYSDGDTVAFLRQDGAKLYVFNDGKYINASALDNDSDFINKEVLAYNFDAKPGDTYTGIVSGDMGYEIEQVAVVAADTIEIRGNKHRRQTLCWEKYTPIKANVVEGIGVGGPLLFFAPYLGNMLAGGYLSPHSDMTLNKITDAAGNKLYPAEDGPGSAHYKSFIREDRVWEYFSTDHDYTFTGHCSLYRWQFIGTEEYEGKTYHRLMRTRLTTWEDPHDGTNNIRDLKVDTVQAPVALMREDKGKVYVLEKEEPAQAAEFSEESPVLCQKPALTVKAGEERMIYDFSLNPGDTLTYPWYPYDEWIANMPFEMDSISYKYYISPTSNFIWREFHFTPAEEYWSKFSYSDIAGNTGRGDLIFVNLGPFPTCDCGHTAFNNLYDLEGNILVQGENRRTPQAGIDGTDADNFKLTYSDGVIRASGEGTLTLEIFSADGIRTARLQAADEISVATSGLLSGVYLVKLKAGRGGSSTLRIRI